MGAWNLLGAHPPRMLVLNGQETWPAQPGAENSLGTSQLSSRSELPEVEQRNLISHTDKSTSIISLTPTCPIREAGLSGGFCGHSMRERRTCSCVCVGTRVIVSDAEEFTVSCAPRPATLWLLCAAPNCCPSCILRGWTPGLSYMRTA